MKPFLAIAVLLCVIAAVAATPANAPPAPAQPEGTASADYGQHVIDLKKKLPAGFSLVTAPPMVVVGDEPPETLKMRAQGTVAWAAGRTRRNCASYLATSSPNRRVSCCPRQLLVLDSRYSWSDGSIFGAARKA